MLDRVDEDSVLKETSNASSLIGHSFHIQNSAELSLNQRLLASDIVWKIDIPAGLI